VTAYKHIEKKSTPHPTREGAFLPNALVKLFSDRVPREAITHLTLGLNARNNRDSQSAATLLPRIILVSDFDRHLTVLNYPSHDSGALVLSTLASTRLPCMLSHLIAGPIRPSMRTVTPASQFSDVLLESEVLGSSPTGHLHHIAFMKGEFVPILKVLERVMKYASKNLSVDIKDVIRNVLPAYRVQLSEPMDIDDEADVASVYQHRSREKADNAIDGDVLMPLIDVNGEKLLRHIWNESALQQRIPDELRTWRRMLGVQEHEHMVEKIMGLIRVVLRDLL